MYYKGSQLKEYVRSRRGRYTELCLAVFGKKKDGLDNYYRDGRNIQIDKLTKIMRATGKPITYFVDFEENELPSASRGNVGMGNNNIINSTISTEAAYQIEHLNEVIRLKDQIIAEKERVITSRDVEIAQWKKRYDDLIVLSKNGSAETGT